MKTIICDFIGLFKKEPLIVFIFCWLFFTGSTLATYATLILIPYMMSRKYASKYIDNLFLLIGSYSITYAFFTFLNGWYEGALGNLLFQSLFPPLFYLLGRCLVDKYQQYIYMIFLLIISLISILVIVEVIYDIRANQFVNVSRKMDSESSATYLGIKLSLIIVSVAVLFSKIKNRKERIYQCLFLLFSIMGLMCTIHLINRTGLILAIVSIIGVIVFNIKKIGNIGLILVLLIAFMPFALDYIDMFEVVEDAYTARNDNSNSSVESMGGRDELWQNGIKSLFINPLGTDAAQKMRYAHNYWLDTARTAGLLPFFFLVLLTIKHVKLTIRLIKLMDWGLIRSLLIICNIGFLLTFFVEPVMEGNMYYVFLFFVFMGLTKQLILFYKHNRITVF